MQVVEGNVRLDRQAGGGPLFDIGIYCINAARAIFSAEPLEVSALRANGSDPRFREVDEMVAATLRFPGERLAEFVVSFGASDVSSYRVVGTKGDLLVEPAYDYAARARAPAHGEGRRRGYAASSAPTSSPPSCCTSRTACCATASPSRRGSRV